MKKICLVLVVAILVVGLVSPALAGKKTITGELVDVKVDVERNVYILYLLDQEPIRVKPDRIIIRYNPAERQLHSYPFVKARRNKSYSGSWKRYYEKAEIIFRDRKEHKEYFGDIKIVYQKDDIGDCFIATAAYGTAVHEDLDILREFRDNTLKKNRLGQKFVDWYYENGPAMAEWVAKSETRKSLVRNLLIEPAVFVLKTIESKD